MVQNEASPAKVVRARSTSIQMDACFLSKTGSVATVTLEEGRTLNDIQLFVW